MPSKNIQILKGWKRKITKEFILIKHLQKYSVFMTEDALYGAIGITNPIADATGYKQLPLIVETSLIPLGEHIIYDSLLSVYPVIVGSNMRRNFLEKYNAIKKRSGIITQL